MDLAATRLRILGAADGRQLGGLRVEGGSCTALWLGGGWLEGELERGLGGVFWGLGTFLGDGVGKWKKKGRARIGSW